VWELSVIDDCNTDSEVGNKECLGLSGVVCNPTSTAIAVQYEGRDCIIVHIYLTKYLWPKVGVKSMEYNSFLKISCLRNGVQIM
jgi:hypothetical protein